MKPINVELSMGHSSGVSDSYWRPTEQEVCKDYLKAVILLTINTDQKAAIQLQKQVAEVTEKNEQRLAENEKETEEMKKQHAELIEKREEDNKLWSLKFDVLAKQIELQNQIFTCKRYDL
jgi:hypothetical protein